MATATRLFLLVSAATNLAVGGKDEFNVTLVREGLKIISSEAVETSESLMEVHGTIPTWLSGRYYRNGPGKFEVTAGNPGTQHVNAMFDGYAVINGFRLNGRDASATRTTKFLHSPRYEQLLKRGDMNYQGKLMLGTTPKRKEFLNPMNLGGEFCVSFIKLGRNSTDVQHLVTAGELAYGMEIDANSLDTIPGANKGPGTMSADFFKYDDKISELGMGSAHPVVLPNGDMYTKTSTVEIRSMGAVTDYNIVRIKAGTAEREIIASYKEIDMGITYAHSFALPSTKYAVLPFWPLGMEKMGLFESIDLVPGFKYDPKRGTSMVVLDLETGHATSFKCNDTFFGFHHTNSWVEDNADGSQDIVADLVTEPDASIFHNLDWERMQNGSNVDHMGIDGVLKRLRIPISAATKVGAPRGFSAKQRGDEFPVSWAKEVATISTLATVDIEAPRINDAYYGNKMYRYVYGWHATRSGNHPNAVAKIDVSDGSSKIWTEKGDEFGVMLGEPVFQARPGATTEDDGVILVSGLHIRTKRCIMLVLDAATLTELARAYDKNHMTFGFHHMYIPDHISVSEARVFV